MRLCRLKVELEVGIQCVPEPAFRRAPQAPLRGDGQRRPLTITLPFVVRLLGRRMLTRAGIPTDASLTAHEQWR